MNIKDVLDKYEQHLQNTVSYKRAKVAINNLSPLHGCPIFEVAKQVEKYVFNRKASFGTINRELTVLQAALRWAFKRGDIGFLPAIARLPSAPPRSRFLTDDEVVRLKEASLDYPHVHHFILIALMTGQRKEAILSLKWDQVDFGTGLVDFNDPSIPLAHRRKGRGVVPMSDSLRSLLIELNLFKNCPYVISKGRTRVRDFRAAWSHIMEKAGLDITPHILRHTVATQLAQKNVPMPQISRLLGHRSTAITERVYAKYSPDFCRQAVNHLNV
jgi:integrase